MDDAEVVAALKDASLPTIHKLAIFLIGGVAAFGAQMLVERGYLKGLDIYRDMHMPELTE